MTVEIIGRACLTPGASTPAELFTLLRQRRSLISEIPDERWDKSRYWHPEVGTPGKTYTFAAGVIQDILGFDPAVFAMSPREAESLDPQQRLIMRMAWSALEDANLTAGALQAERVGVYVGASSLEYSNLFSGDPSSASPYFMTGNTLSVVSNRISHVFGLQGPSMTVDTACSSGLVALDLAVKALEAGEIDTALVGSVNALAHPLSFVGFAQARMLSPRGKCHAYDNGADGYVRAEGGAVFVLRRTDRAQAHGDRSHAQIVASSVNSAGRTNFISLPSGEAQMALLNAVYRDNHIDVSRLAFVEGHGTGTRVGDPAEVLSVGREIGQRRSAPIPIGSIKTNIGHTEPASGLLGMMKAMLALENNLLPASLNFETPNKDIDFETLNVRVAAEPVDLMPSRTQRMAAINSFGFGGTNAHVVIGDPVATVEQPQQAAHLFMASAQARASLDLLVRAYRDEVRALPEREVPAYVSALGANRHHLKHRLAVPFTSKTALVQSLEAFLDGRKDGPEASDAIRDQTKTAFVFAGNGSQWAGMAVDAYRGNSAFRARFDTSAALFDQAAGLSLVDLLFNDDLAELLSDTRVAQPLLFAIQASLSDTLVEMGLRPSAAFGHSIGEVAAAYAAGALSLVDGVSIVTKRSRHQHKIAGRGRMLAVSVSGEEALELAERAGLATIAIAGRNAPGAATLAGSTDDILAFRDYAADHRVAVQLLDIDYPFHHPLIDVAREGFLSDLTAVSTRNTVMPFISTVFGNVVEGNQLGPSYWWKNIREPVAFHQATTTAIELGCTLFIEIAPRPILSSYLRETLRTSDTPGTVVATLLRGGKGWAGDPVAQAFARAVGVGARFDPHTAIGRRNSRIDLPPLPLDLSRPESKKSTEAIDIYGRNSVHKHSLLGWRVNEGSTTWRNSVDAHLYPDLAGHVVDGRSILPGSAFIEMILAAGRQYFGNDAFEITNLEILHAMDLSSTHLLEVATVISPETGTVEIKSRERLREEEWAVNAVARLRPLVAADVRTFGGTPVPSGPPIEAEHVYDVARRFGLDYGEPFRLLESIRQIGPDLFEVRLRPAAAPANPYLRYTLDPVSTDAAFHGLVGLFDRFVHDREDAPYIPVRFGSVQLHQAQTEIRSARLAIEKRSRFSLKASVQVLDASGRAVATLNDCRFRRTRLRPRKTLETSSFHYEIVPAGTAFAKPALVELTSLLPGGREKNEGTLLLEAASFRACYDILAAAVRSPRGLKAAVRGMPTSIAAWLHACLQHLQSVGLARMQDEEWVLADEPSLPPFDEIHASFHAESPDRSVEALLLNNARALAMELVQAFGDGEDGEAIAQEARRAVSRASVEHVASHAPAVVERQQDLLNAVDEILIADGPTTHIVELGSTSRAFSARLAARLSAAGGRLTIVEPRERVRGELKIAFQQEAHVEILAALGPNDGTLFVSLSNGAFNLLELGSSGEAIGDSLKAGAGLLLSLDAPNVFSDLAFGMQDGWFARTLDPAFPVGSIATRGDWTALFERLGNAVEVRASTGEYGPAILVLASGTEAPERAAPAWSDRSIVFSMQEMADVPGLCRLTGDENSDRAIISDALGATETGAVRAAFTAGRPGSIENADSLNRQVAALSILAKELAAKVEDGAMPWLVVILPGGSPASTVAHDAVNAGLWTFMRVVQNEYPALEIHLLDAPVEAQALALAQDLADRKSRNREWIHDPASGNMAALRVVPGPTPRELRQTAEYEASTLRQDAVSQLATLDWQASGRRAPGAGEVEIAVAATGLNYRDVMWAIGLLPEEALEDGFAGASIGMECSGTISAVGKGVSGFSVGDKVMAVAPQAFSTHVAVAAAGVSKLPDGVSVVAGATIPVVFLTAWYALVELGRVREGETVLIHGGAGGVGLAALQIALMRGAEVIATAGSHEKRALLQTLGAHHVLDSRSLQFKPDVMHITKGGGVDLVLNSLFGEAMELSIGLLKPFGRFLELGKRDYYADRKIGLRPFRRNISYFGIDADQLLKSRPELTAQLLVELGQQFAEGRLVPVAFRTFAHDEIRDAFRLMQSSGHVGKIVVTPPAMGLDPVPCRIDRAPPLDPDGHYLVAGGTGGFGFEAARWLVRRGASKLALCSRRGVLDRKASETVEAWRADGIEVHVAACDITDVAALEALLDELRARAPVKGVIHAAMVLDDARLESLDTQRNRPVIDVKAKGADNLHRLTRNDALDTFLMFSSITTLIGNIGQANYVAGNGFLEGLARHRRGEGLPALAVCFGAISDAGYLLADETTRAILNKKLGKFSMTAADALAKLEDFIAADPGTVEAATVAIADLNMTAARSLPVVSSPLFEVPLRGEQDQAALSSDQQIDLSALLQGRSPADGERLVLDLIIQEFALTLRVPSSEITGSKLVREIGVDSLMAMELGMNFQQKTGLDLPLSNVGDTTTVGEIAHKVYLKVTGGAHDDAPITSDIVDRLAKRHTVPPAGMVGQG